MPVIIKMLTLHHGTSTKHLAGIRSTGLPNPFLTNSVELARYYAEEACGTAGGDPVILSTLVNPNNLRYDGNSMDEPVGHSGDNIAALEAKVRRAWNRAARSHPEWVDNEFDAVNIPEVEYRISLNAVGSCLHAGTILPEQITAQFC